MWACAYWCTDWNPSWFGIASYPGSLWAEPGYEARFGGDQVDMRLYSSKIGACGMFTI